MSSDTPAFKFKFLQMTLNFELMKWTLLVVPTQLLLTITLSIDIITLQNEIERLHTSTHQRETIHRRWTLFRNKSQKSEQKLIKNGYILLKSIYFNSKFKVTSRNPDFECRHIRTHIKKAKRNRLKFNILKSPICFFLNKIL